MVFVPSRGANLVGRNRDRLTLDDPGRRQAATNLPAIFQTPARSVGILIIAFMFCKHEVDKMEALHLLNQSWLH